MTRTANIYEAKTHFSKLVEEVERGGEIIIARAGRPVARLVPLAENAQPRVPGVLKGRIKIADDFDAPLPDDYVDAFAARD